MAVTILFVSLLATNLLLSTSYSASVARVSERDLEAVLERAARSDSYSFYKDFGRTQFGGYYDKDNDSGGFNASHKFDNGLFGGRFDWDNNGRLSGGGSGKYTSDDGTTKFNGDLDFGKDGNTKGAFSFSHHF